MNILGFPVVECEEAGESVYLMPKISVSVPVYDGMTVLDQIALEQKLIADEIIAAARRGEVGVIKNVKL